MHRLARHFRRTAPKTMGGTRPSDIAKPRITDGVKADHHLRFVSIASVFPLLAHPTEPQPGQPTDPRIPDQPTPKPVRDNASEPVA